MSSKTEPGLESSLHKQSIGEIVKLCAPRIEKRQERFEKLQSLAELRPIWNLKELSERLGTSRQTLYNWNEEGCLVVNSAGNGTKWTNTTGWSVYTCKGQTQSDKLADCLCQAAIKNFPGRRIRTDFSDWDSDWEENFFMDGLDLEFLQSKACKQAIVDTHVEG